MASFSRQMASQKQIFEDAALLDEEGGSSAITIARVQAGIALVVDPGQRDGLDQLDERSD